MRIEFDVDIRVRQSYFAWFADRLTSVSRITFDAQILASQNYLVKFQAFLPDLDNIVPETWPGYFSIRLNGWITDGHGVNMSWLAQPQDSGSPC